MMDIILFHLLITSLKLHFLTLSMKTKVCFFVVCVWGFCFASTGSLQSRVMSQLLYLYSLLKKSKICHIY